MCLTSCNTFQKHLLSQKENLIFWPKKWIFEISEAVFDSFWQPSMRKWHCKATLKVSKNILRPSIKNRLDTFVPNVPRINLIPFSWSYDQNWLRETLKTEKKAKTPPRWTFWNNRLHLSTKFEPRQKFLRPVWYLQKHSTSAMSRFPTISRKNVWIAIFLHIANMLFP